MAPSYPRIWGEDPLIWTQKGNWQDDCSESRTSDEKVRWGEVFHMDQRQISHR